MWEFSLNLRASDFDLAKHIYTTLKAASNQNGGVITSHEENGYIRVLVAVDEKRKEDMEVYLGKCITKIICTHYKSLFLDKYLYLPEHDKIGMIAFKKALLNFDKETDSYIIQKSLSFDNDLFLDSFYDFKLRNLKAKWTELVGLANENREYLMSSESFIDLLKFLVDNLDICESEISVFEEGDGYKIYLEDTANDDIYQNRILSQENLVSSIIDLSPQKINLYCHAMNQATNLLERIYEERIQFKTDKTPTEKDVIKNFK